jgi:hypothetical protein
MLLGNGGEKLEFAMRQDCGGLMLEMAALQTAPKMQTAPENKKLIEHQDCNYIERSILSKGSASAWRSSSD